MILLAAAVRVGTFAVQEHLPGKPVAYDYGLLSMQYKLLWGYTGPPFLGRSGFQVRKNVEWGSALWLQGIFLAAGL